MLIYLSGGLLTSNSAVPIATLDLPFTFYKSLYHFRIAQNRSQMPQFGSARPLHSRSSPFLIEETPSLLSLDEQPLIRALNSLAASFEIRCKL